MDKVIIYNNMDKVLTPTPTPPFLVKNCKCNLRDIYTGRYNKEGVYTLKNHEGVLIDNENEVLKIFEGNPNEPF